MAHAPTQTYSIHTFHASSHLRNGKSDLTVSVPYIHSFHSDSTTSSQLNKICNAIMGWVQVSANRPDPLLSVEPFPFLFLSSSPPPLSWALAFLLRPFPSCLYSLPQQVRFLWRRAARLGSAIIIFRSVNLLNFLNSAN